jgi:hypothetical protein
MDKRFLEAFLTPKGTHLCGYKLYPWCLKHRLWLTALNHPIVTDRIMKPADIILFAKVCSESGNLKPSLSDHFHGIRLMSGKRYASAVELAHDHIKVSTWPQFWEKSERDQGGSPRHNGIPWPLAIITNLVKHGISFEQALHMPESQAVWMSAGFSVGDGASMEIFSSEDEALLDELAKVGNTPNGT